MYKDGKQYDKFILNGKTYEKFYLNNKVYGNTLNDGLILDLPLQNNFTDYSASGISMVAGNANGFPSFVSDGSGGYALYLNGTRSIKTAVNLPINSDKISLSFDMKTSSITTQFLMELSNDSTGKNAFYLALVSSKLRFGNRTPDNTIDITYSSGVWQNIVITVDRSLPASSEIKVYVDGLLKSPAINSRNNTSGEFIKSILYIGQRAGISGGFVGQLKNLKIYNYPIL